MALEDFRHLLEIQSLDKQISKHLEIIEEERNRLIFLEKGRKRRSEELDQFNASIEEKSLFLKSHEKELFNVEDKFQKAKDGLDFVQNQKEAKALELQISVLGPKVDELQEEILVAMEEEEELICKSKEAQSFLTGSLEGMKEIQEEVNEIIEKENQQISQYEIRIESLEKQVNSQILNSFKESRKKNRFRSSLSFIFDKACSICRFEVDILKAEQTERAIMPELCSGCNRLLTPLSAKA